MKDNILIIITYLSTSAANRGKLDTSLIQMYEPYAISLSKDTKRLRTAASRQFLMPPNIEHNL